MLAVNGHSCLTAEMSDYSDTSDNPASEDTTSNSVCRDFLRNVCLRGRRCRYRHPSSAEALQLSHSQDLTFCHDFQNAGCRRPSCRFVHCTRDEEERFRRDGVFPARLQHHAAMGLLLPVPNAGAAGDAGAPVCKDHLKGECRRGVRCKFRHVTPSVLTAVTVTSDNNNGAPLAPYDEYARCYDLDMAPKRRRIDDAGYHMDYIPHFDEEKALLRRKLDQLRKQVSDLSATNEVLLEQNARFRTVKGRMPIVAVSGVMTTAIPPPTQPLPPSGSIASVGLAPQPLDVITAVSLPPRLDPSGSTALLSYPVMSHAQLPNCNNSLG